MLFKYIATALSNNLLNGMSVSSEYAFKLLSKCDKLKYIESS